MVTDGSMGLAFVDLGIPSRPFMFSGFLIGKDPLFHYPIASMGLVYLPTFTIKIIQM